MKRKPDPLKSDSSEAGQAERSLEVRVTELEEWKARLIEAMK